MRSDAELLLFFVGGILMLFVLFSVLCVMYLAYFKMDEISSGLSSSKVFLLRKSLIGRDPYSRFFIMVSIGVAFSFSARHIKLGELDADDYNRFPFGLKIAIKGSYLMGLVAGLMLFSVVGFGKWMGWVK